MLKKIASFTINHDILCPGLYVSRQDGDIITYDLRMKYPNHGEYLDQAGLHTLEHLGATFLRSSSFQDQVIYFGPMGCRTGFYLIMRDTVSKPDLLDLLQNTFRFIAQFEGEIPGTLPRECGNYREHNLENAKAEAAQYLTVLEQCTEQTFSYPEESSCV